MTRFKLRSERHGDHEHVTVFVTQSEADSPTYANAGKLVLRVGEYQIFGAALAHARDTFMPGHFGVVFEPVWEADVEAAPLMAALKASLAASGKKPR